MINPPKIAVFLSGRGSNFSAILDAIDRKLLDAEVSLVISNDLDAGGLLTSIRRQIPTVVLERACFKTGNEFSAKMLGCLRSHKIDLIVLAGYMRKIPPAIIREFPRRILNIHPALLPKFGGKGMFGHFVHEAVISAGETESGPTVHLVDEIYDHGEILGQRAIPVLPGETPESLAKRVLEIEHQLLPETIQNYLNIIKLK